MTDSIIRGKPLAEEQLGALTLGGFLHEVCSAHGPKEALVYHLPDGSVLRMSYRQVWEQAFTVARALAARGVTKETRVGLLVTNRAEWVTAMFGIALAGGTCVALSTFAKGAELEYMLRVGDVSLLIFERSILARDFASELIEICPELGSGETPIASTRLPYLRRAVCIGEPPAGSGIERWEDFLKGPLAAAPLVEAMGAEVAATDRGFVFFSSGSTAKPKAIVQTHRAAAIQCWRWPKIFGLQGDARSWTANGFFWSGNFCMALGATFASGGCMILQSAFNAGEALRLMEIERVTLPIAWPHQWGKLVEDPGWSKADLSTLKYVGETAALRTHPTVNADWQEPVAAYGSTETFTLVSVHPSGTPREIADGNNGYALPGNTIRIVEPLTGQVLPLGEAGEIAVKGPTLMPGYLRMPLEQTFDEEGFLRTGDGGFIDAEGRLHWKGRLNDIIKTGGANVSPLEINDAIAQCPGVKIAATVGVPHDALGEMVVTCIVLHDGASLDERGVRAYAGERLSSYKVPRRVLFIDEAELQMTASNKIKTAQLRELAAAKLAG